MKNQTLVLLIAAALGLALAFFGPRFAPEVFTPSTRPILNLLVGLICLFALYQRWQARRQGDSQ